MEGHLEAVTGTGELKIAFFLLCGQNFLCYRETDLYLGSYHTLQVLQAEICRPLLKSYVFGIEDDKTLTLRDESSRLYGEVEDNDVRSHSTTNFSLWPHRFRNIDSI